MFRRIRIRAGSANFYTHNTPTAHMEQEGKLPAGCSKSSSSKAAASEGPQAYPLGYVEGLNDARTPLAGCFSIRYYLLLPARSQDRLHLQWPLIYGLIPREAGLLGNPAIT